MSTKTPTGSFYAVRRGKGGLEKCIFLQYKDAQPFIEVSSNEDDTEEEEPIEYHVFDVLEDAAAYLQTTTEPLDAQMLASIATVVNLPAGSAAAPPTPTATPASKKRRTSYTSFESTDGGQHRKPTKKWEECFAILKESKENGFKDEDMEKMTKWMKDQRYNYKLFQQGKPSSMTADKIRRLQQVGFQLPNVQCTAPLVKTEPSREKRGIYKKWFENRDALKHYMDTHNGSTDVPKNDPQHAKLWNWLNNQQTEYKKFCNNQESSMTQEKLDLLKEIGFEFNYISFEDRLLQLQEFKQEYGHVHVPTTHPELGKWMQSIRRQCKSFAETAQTTRDIDGKRFAQLMALGLDPTLKASQKNPLEEATKWEEMFARLQEYKAQHGDFNVKRTEEYRDLQNWLVLQRSEYKKLQNDKPSRLTAARLVKFTSIGFEFGKRGNYKSWEQRVEQLREYKKIHGHVNIPVSDPNLGEFLSRQRIQYAKLR